MAESKAFFDAAAHWNQRYQGDEFQFGTEPNAWLREQANAFPAGGRLLCVADGEGRNSVWLARQGFKVEAFDIADVGVAKARAFAAREGVAVDYQVADADAFAWPREAYDGVAAIFIQFAEPRQRARLFERIVASLRPGGVLVLQGYATAQLALGTGGPSQVAHLYSEALLREAFRELQILQLRSYEAELREGSRHQGRSALIGLVARR